MKKQKAKYYLSAILLCLIGSFSFSQVTITSPNVISPACSYPSDYFTIPAMVINEPNTAARGSFSVGTNQTIVIQAPANFELEAGSGVAVFTAARDITSASVTVSTSAITITYTVAGLTKLDRLTISNVRARSLTGSAGSFIRTGGTAIIDGDFIGNTYASATVNGLNGLKTVGPAPSDFATLTEAISTLKSRGVTGSTILELKVDYTSAGETFPLNLQGLNCLNTSRRLTIRPAASATNLQISSSNITTTINFNGTSYVNIDGRAGGTGASVLTISNTTTSATALQFINGSSNNQIQYCQFKGVNTGNKGVILFGSSTALTGNTNNLIQYCDISGGNTTPKNAIVSVGSPGKSNRNNTISHNLIHDYFNSALDCSGILLMSNTDSWSIEENSFYLTSVQNFTAIGAAWSAIQLNNRLNGTNIQITQNYIGGQGANCSGNALTITGRGRIQLIEMNGATGTASEIQGNTISNINFNSSNTGLQSFIQHLGGSLNIGTSIPNILGSATQSQSVEFNMTGAAVSSPATVSLITLGLANVASGTVVCSKNIVGGITVTGTGFARFRMIDVRGSVYQFTIKDNVFGNTTSNNIVNSTNAALTGIISVSFNASDFEISGNTFRNFISNSAVATEGVVGGIHVQAANNNLTSSNYLINNNIIQNLTSSCTKLNSIGCFGITTIFTKPSNNIISGNQIERLIGNTSNFAGRISAINVTTTALAPCVVRKNFINSLIATSGNSYSLIGISHFAGQATYANNVIRIGLQEDGTALNGNHLLTGISENGGSVDVLFNTVYITGSNTQGNNISIAFSSTGTGTRNVLNNIFRNNRSNTSANNYAIWVNTMASFTSNNNNLLADGTNGNTGYLNGTARTTLSNWQAVSGTDAASIAQDPLFYAPDANTINLNINSASPSNNAGTNVSPANNISDDFRGIARSATTPDMGAFEMNVRTGFWSGVVSREWNNPDNWEDGTIPTIQTDVTIEAGQNNVAGDYMPLITWGDMAFAKNLKLALPQSLLAVTGSGVLQLSGSIINAGTLDLTDGSLELKGDSVQSIAGSLFKQNSIKNLIISNNVNVTSTANDTLKIINELSFGNVNNKTLNTGNHITFISNEENTARIADLTNDGTNSGNLISGNVTAERFLPVHGKAWQFMSAPTNGQTIKNAWQEGASAPLANPNPGFGTIITGKVADAIAQGFDIYSPASASILSFNENTGNWTSVGSTNLPVNSPNGYLVFVRGDRTVTNTGQESTVTKLRSSGTVYQPANMPPVVNVQAGKFKSVANPYLSAIDFSKLDRAGGVADVFYLWDPLLFGGFGLGGWQTFTSNAPSQGYTVSPGGGSYPNENSLIQSGQSFLVHAPLSGGTISFKETAKVAGSSMVFRTANSTPSIKTDLYVVKNNAALIDGTLTRFSDEYADEINMEDAYKIPTSTPSISLINSEKLLSVEKKKLHQNDSINYVISGLVPQTYQLVIDLKNLHTEDRIFVMKDKFSGKEQLLHSNENTFAFDVTEDKLSSDGNRFTIYFNSKQSFEKIEKQVVNTKQTKEEINSSDAIQVFPNPVTGKKMNISFPPVDATYIITIFNSAGNKMLERSVRVREDDHVKIITLPGAMNGMYHVEFSNKKEKSITKQIIVL